MQDAEHLLQGKAFILKNKSKRSASINSPSLSAVQICILLYMFVHFAFKAFLFNVLSSCLRKTVTYKEKYKLRDYWSQPSEPLFPCMRPGMLSGDACAPPQVLQRHFSFLSFFIVDINPLCLSYSLTINKMPVYSDMSTRMRFELHAYFAYLFILISGQNRQLCRVK